MNKSTPLALPRRDFLNSAPALVLGSCLTRLAPTRLAALQTPASLPEELSSAELEAVEKSIMAKDLKKYFGQGYNCAESTLMAGLHYLKKPEDLVWVACGFGRGMYNRDVCGIVTAGVMVLGLAAGQLKVERKEARDWSQKKVQEYWAWWTSQAPLRCPEIRKEGTRFEVCLRLGLLAAVKIEELVSSPKVSA